MDAPVLEPPPAPPSHDDGCPHDNTEEGFGLAGGGYGPYIFCHDCQTVIEKTQEP